MGRNNKESLTLSNDQIRVSAAKLEMPASFEVLSQNDIWICDTGASSHSTFCRLSARNERDYGSTSLGHAGEVRADERLHSIFYPLHLVADAAEHLHRGLAQKVLVRVRVRVRVRG